MATPPNAATALTESDAQNTALTDAANAAFIDQFVQAQNNAISLGHSVVFLTTFAHCDISFLMNYFINLNYFVTLPDLAPINGAQPAELFGPAWIAFWENQVPNLAGHPLRNPVRLGIAWSPPNFQFLPPINEPV